MNDHDPTEQRNFAAVRSAFDAWRDGTGGPWTLLDDDAIWEIVGNSVAAGVYHGKRDFLGNVIGPFNARLSVPLRPTVRNTYVDGDTVIVFFSAEGVARDDVPYRNTYTWYLTFDGDRIVKGTAFFDSIEFNDFWQRVKPAQS